VRSTAAICPLSPPSMRSRHYGTLHPLAAQGLKQRYHCGLSIRAAAREPNMGSRFGSLENHLEPHIQTVFFWRPPSTSWWMSFFFTLAKLVLRWLADRWVFESVRAWIGSLRPYPTLALFILPVLLLEPVKPIAAYLMAIGHIISGLVVLVAGELLKLLLIERLFNVSRDKLMAIPAFAWC